MLLLFLLWKIPVLLAENAQSQQLPIQVTSCQLENHPGLYNHKLVEVTGRIYYGKFNFNIDSECKPHTQAGIWVDLGGDVEAPGAYWGIANYLPKQKNVDVQVRGVSVPLVHDALLDRFVNDVGATRFRKPNGEGCGSECLFYEVTATVRGRFFSAAGGGFGMEQCCHLLVIEKVLRVSSRRTSVPAGGEFQCTSDRWQPTEQEMKVLATIPGCVLRGGFENCAAALAKHWGDTIDSAGKLDYSGPWMSPDMMLSYAFSGGYIQTGKQIEMKPSSAFVRRACHAISPPKPASDHLYCDFHRTGWPFDKDNASASQKTIAASRETWRASDMAQVGWLAYEDAVRRWQLSRPTPLRLINCTAWPPGKDGEGAQQQSGYCTWLAHDGLQEVVASLHKAAYREKDASRIDKASWFATEVEDNVCRAEPEAR